MEENTIKVFRVIIAGTRFFNDYSLLKETADRLLADKITSGYSIVIVSGGCAGADMLGKDTLKRMDTALTDTRQNGRNTAKKPE